MSEEKCPHCEKHCEADAPQCPRGRFLSKGLPPGIDSEEVKLFDLLRRSAFGYRPRQGWNRKLSQRRILLILDRWGTMTQRELMGILGIRSASLSELLAKIEADGFISRTPSEQDKRSVSISLTETGKAETGKAEQPETAFGALSAEEKRSITAILEKLVRSWDSGADDGTPPEGGGFPHGSGGFPPRGGFPEGFPGGFPGGGFPPPQGGVFRGAVGFRSGGDRSNDGGTRRDGERGDRERGDGTRGDCTRGGGAPQGGGFRCGGRRK
ncbi:MAG: MarR family transcriptional regulator [Oscillospiraceae bacterium]|jgi:DNA-binding MarR family transcriptional regulator|nr:MarR family transcriptional regulator [Oscillospiraceae bacterium]